MRILIGFYIAQSKSFFLNVFQKTIQNTLKPLFLETSLIGKALNFGFREYRFESRVSNIVHLFNPYAHTISHIKLGLARKAFFCNIICTMQSLKVLHLFKYLRIVRRFVHHEHNCFRVYLTYNKFFQPLRTIKIYYKLKQQISISLKSLQ